MKVIGVTGGVGSGKTTFCHFLEELGAACIDVDQVARQLIQAEPAIRNCLIEAFGPDIYDVDGKLIRNVLAEIVFDNKDSQSRLNEIVWPIMIESLKSLIALSKLNSDKAFLIIDMAVLFETGFEKWLDGVVVVHAPREKRIEWLHHFRKWSKKTIENRMQSQMPVDEKLKMADWIVENFGATTDLKKKAALLYNQFID